jgi:hypothetical protein
MFKKFEDFVKNGMFFADQVKPERRSLNQYNEGFLNSSIISQLNSFVNPEKSPDRHRKYSIHKNYVEFFYSTSLGFLKKPEV